MKSFLFTHKAIGQTGKEITVYKIRTMRGQIPERRNARVSLSGLLDESDQERMTILGKILRPIGLDEIPQFYNILILKDMQLVGIRPFLPEEFDLLPDRIKERLQEEKPGFIPAEAYYKYNKGDLLSRIEAIEMYIEERPKGFRKFWIGINSLLRRWFRYSNR